MLKVVECVCVFWLSPWFERVEGGKMMLNASLFPSPRFDRP